MRRFFTLKKGGDITVSLELLSIEQLKAINRIRVGEEHEITNLVDYLTHASVRE